MLKKQTITCLLAVIGMLYLGVSSGATLSFVLANTTVNQGDTFGVDVVISDLGGSLVGVFDYTVDFDPLGLASTNVQFSNALGDPFSAKPLPVIQR